ncbi:sulfurtransferase-like selenium metabolism protein YedF [Desulfurobacterium atlanticum]|uniref:Selenium metabolism protein YedF n=1 Tax=Desulfurobacterium atlanticum TaxID=240169 RepID=A0A238YZZ2_9BACT|nr:sulfurtransferase-like selenium metabolism protein YedF [Desulfurobacterium atlanticum]SNR76271.1 selenium metabolism protein YedF [Desulfurobacterium atlanticum]
MEKVIDCKGLPCPEPVLKTKQALEEIEEGIITVIVDNKAAKENVSRFAKNKGCTIDVKEKEGLFYITIAKGFTCTLPEENSEKKTGDYAVLIASTYVGEDKELGEILIKGFIKTFINAEPLPKGIVLINTAVKLACKGADKEIVEALKELEGKGAKIICCGTCLNYFNLLDSLEVGEASNAYDVVQFLSNAKSVVRL